MTKIRLNRIFMMAILSALLVWVSGMRPNPLTLAAPASDVILAPTQDSYTDLNDPAANLDEDLLNAANSSGFPGTPDVATKYVFLEFDLSSVSFEIKSAVLSLSTLTCGGLVPVDAVDIEVYGVDNADSWLESTLTWANQPAISTGVLTTLDDGSATADLAKTYTWTDNKQGDFATWLETQRTANDSSATLVLAIDNSNYPGMADIFFEDRESTGDNYGCSDAISAPSLKVSDTREYDIFIPLVLR